MREKHWISLHPRQNCVIVVIWTERESLPSAISPSAQLCWAAWAGEAACPTPASHQPYTYSPVSIGLSHAQYKPYIGPYKARTNLPPRPYIVVHSSWPTALSTTKTWAGCHPKQVLEQAVASRYIQYRVAKNNKIPIVLCIPGCAGQQRAPRHGRGSAEFQASSPLVLPRSGTRGLLAWNSTDIPTEFLMPLKLTE